MVWLYWLQDRDSMPIWYTINHPTTQHTYSETQWPIAAHQWHFVLRNVSRSQSCHLLTPSHPWVPHRFISVLVLSYNEIVFEHSIFITRFLTHSCMYFCVFSAALHTAHSVFAENISWDGWVLVGAHCSECQKMFRNSCGPNTQSWIFKKWIWNFLPTSTWTNLINSLFWTRFL